MQVKMKTHRAMDVAKEVRDVHFEDIITDYPDYINCRTMCGNKLLIHPKSGVIYYTGSRAGFTHGNFSVTETGKRTSKGNPIGLLWGFIPVVILEVLSTSPLPEAKSPWIDVGQLHEELVETQAQEAWEDFLEKTFDGLAPSREKTRRARVTV